MKAFSALFVYSILLSLRTSTTLDTITPSQSIRDGETLISAGGRFEMGLFSPGSLESRYVGIWFGMSNETVVWVANRETPLKNYHGVLKVTNKGILVLLHKYYYLVIQYIKNSREQDQQSNCTALGFRKSCCERWKY